MKWEQLAADRGIFVRKCSICGSPVIAGYCVNDGMDYYCSDDCLHMVFTDEEWEQAYNEDWGYYTEWFDEYDDDEIDTICNELTQSWEAEQKGAKLNNYPPYFTFLYDADFGTIIGVIMSKTTTSEDIRRIVEDIRKEKPDEWTWDDIWMKLPSDCYVYDREWDNTVEI